MKSFDLKSQPARALAVVLTVMLMTLSGNSLAEEAKTQVLEGRYTVEQAGNGEDLFTDKCRHCHVPRDFRAIFQPDVELPPQIHDYYNLISVAMPQDSPGTLGEDAYLDIIAYLLSLNKIEPLEDGHQHD